MSVPSYQMHNVLNVYSKQLMQNITSEGKKSTLAKPWANQVSLTLEGKRQATADKVLKDIFDKITRFGSLTEKRHPIIKHGENKIDKAAKPDKTDELLFVFNAIDTINKKQRNTLSIEDSSFLIEQLDQLSKEARDKKTESWI